MVEFVKLLLGLSLAGTAVAGLVALARRLLRGQIPHRVFYYLWLAVVLRLLLPLGLGSQVAGWAGSLLAQPAQQPGTSQMEPQPENTDSLPVTPPANEAAGLEQAQLLKPEEIQFVPEKEPFTLATLVATLLFLAWLVGAAALLLRRLYAWRHMAAHLKRLNTVQDTAILALYHGECERLGIAKPPRLVADPLAPAPLLAGLAHPVVVLPGGAHMPGRGLAGQKLALVLRHELIHYKRGDLWYRWLVQLAVCVHWFNPALCAVQKAVERDCEYSCDEAVLRGLEAPERRRYGEALLDTVLAGPVYHYKPVVLLGEQAAEVKKRLESILHGGGYGRRAAALALCCVLAVAGFAACAGGSLPGAGQAVLANSKLDGREWEPQTARAAVAVFRNADGLLPPMYSEIYTHYSTVELADMLEPMALEEMPESVRDVVLYEGSEQGAYLIEADGRRYVYCNMGASITWLYSDAARGGLTLQFLGRNDAENPGPILAELLYDGPVNVFYTTVPGLWAEPLVAELPFTQEQMQLWEEDMTDRAVVDSYHTQSVYLNSFDSAYPVLVEDAYIHCFLQFSGLRGSSKTAAFTLEEDTTVDIEVTGIVRGPYKMALFQEVGLTSRLVYTGSDHNGVGNTQTITLPAGSYQLALVGEGATGLVSLACVKATEAL